MILDMDTDLQQIDRALRRWYKAFGIDHALHTVDSTGNETESQLSQSNRSAPATISSLSFKTLDSLKEAVMRLDCPLKRMANNTVFSDGPPSADIMVIGEAPGQEEDMQGVPFVGQSGKLLDNMLRAIGFMRKDVYISNVVFWRPPGNRTPTVDEVSFCLPYVDAHIELVNPKGLLLLGGVAIKALLRNAESIARARGTVHTYRGISAVATYHPAFLLRSPAQKQSVFRDLLLLKKTIQTLS
ncbi:MAG: uracil-DNA glycosylase [Holosporales bacterium]|jgi:DNA polymerase|nr:uracil-DNA glycosylase [Holosporales bacterium]